MIRRAFILVLSFLALSLAAVAQETKQDKQEKPYFVSKDLYEIFVLGDSLAASALAHSAFSRLESSPSGFWASFSSVARAAAHDDPISFCNTISVK